MIVPILTSPNIQIGVCIAVNVAAFLLPIFVEVFDWKDAGPPLNLGIVGLGVLFGCICACTLRLKGQREATILCGLLALTPGLIILIVSGAVGWVTRR